MKNCVAPSVSGGSKKGGFRKTKPERVEKPSKNFTLDVVGEPSIPIGAYQWPSRSMRWKLPFPPRMPPLCESPACTIVPAVGNGRSIRVSRNRERPTVDRTQSLQRNAAVKAVLVDEPVKLC